MTGASGREQLLALLRTRSEQRGDFQLSSGRRASFYVDARTTTLSAEGLIVVGEVGLRTIRAAGWNPALVGGLTLGADPVACGIAAASHRSPPPIDAFTVRKAAKEHGTERRIEGPFRSGARVVIVEDVITTGRSALTAIEAVAAAGGHVAGVLAVVDREEGGRAALEQAGHDVITLVTLSELAVGRAPAR